MFPYVYIGRRFQPRLLKRALSTDLTFTLSPSEAWSSAFGGHRFGTLLWSQANPDKVWIHRQAFLPEGGNLAHPPCAHSRLTAAIGTRSNRQPCLCPFTFARREFERTRELSVISSCNNDETPVTTNTPSFEAKPTTGDRLSSQLDRQSIEGGPEYVSGPCAVGRWPRGRGR
jgi:hypothetical protein